MTFATFVENDEKTRSRQDKTKTFSEHLQRTLVTFETFDQSDEET